jgi:hypothetical protein
MLPIPQRYNTIYAYFNSAYIDTILSSFLNQPLLLIRVLQVHVLTNIDASLPVIIEVRQTFAPEQNTHECVQHFHIVSPMTTQPAEILNCEINYTKLLFIFIMAGSSIIDCFMVGVEILV